MKKSDLDKMTDDDLQVRLTENKEELASALMKFRMGQFKRTSEFPRLRKDIARINTLLSKRTAKAGA